ncbi:MAG: hypothetical protein ABIH39_08540 [Candidatus Margulisiibacteriota bacterium]
MANKMILIKEVVKAGMPESVAVSLGKQGTPDAILHLIADKLYRYPGLLGNVAKELHKSGVDGFFVFGDLLKSYDKKFNVFIIPKELIQKLSSSYLNIIAIAINIEGLVFIDSNTLDQANTGDKESIKIIRHEHYHNVHIGGCYDINDIESRVMGELFAEVAAHSEVYGVGALLDKKTGLTSICFNVSAYLTEFTKNLDKKIVDILNLKLLMIILVGNRCLRKGEGDVFLARLKNSSKFKQVLELVDNDLLFSAASRMFLALKLRKDMTKIKFEDVLNFELSPKEKRGERDRLANIKRRVIRWIDKKTRSR